MFALRFSLGLAAYSRLSALLSKEDSIYSRLGSRLGSIRLQPSKWNVSGLLRPLNVGHYALTYCIN